MIPAGGPLPWRSRAFEAAYVLIAAGLCFRIWAVGLARFTGDESYFWATARNTATFEAAPVFGPSMTSSNAYHPGPLFYYLMAVPQRLGTSPWFGGIFVALLHAASAWLVFLLARREGGDRAGLIALSLLAFAPWDVLYADRIWLSCVAPVWGMFVLYAAVRAPESPRWQGALLFFAATCPQLHMSAPIVWAAAALLLFLARPFPISKRAVATGLALTFAAYAIPLWHELNHGFANTRAILSEGGGNEGWEQLRFAPLRVFGYALLYATSEIGYHFQTGYWRPFDELAHYTSGPGLRSWLDGVSIAVALAGWASAIAFGAARRFTLAIGVALVAATALLITAKKGYFPHYTNLLMPAVMVPVACGLARLQRLVYPAVALAAAAMFASSARYYQDVDALNGLSPTLGMVERAMHEPGPFRVEFEGFQNGFAWQMLVNTKYRRPFDTPRDAPVVFRVKNRAPWAGGDPPSGASLHGPALMERHRR